MDAISYSYADKQAKRIKKFINNPDSNSGIITVPKVIESGESVTVPAGRVAVLPNVQVDGTLNVEAGGEVFIPSGATFSKVVETEGNQDIDGIKNFLTSPIVPTPTTGTQAVNKDYADLKVALAQFTGTNQNLSGNGYQKLPGGLIIQWGASPTSTANVAQSFTLPISFPNAGFSAVGNHLASGGETYAECSVSKTNITVRTPLSAGTIFWIAIGN